MIALSGFHCWANLNLTRQNIIGIPKVLSINDVTPLGCGGQGFCDNSRYISVTKWVGDQTMSVLENSSNYIFTKTKICRTFWILTFLLNNTQLLFSNLNFFIRQHYCYFRIWTFSFDNIIAIFKLLKINTRFWIAQIAIHEFLNLLVIDFLEFSLLKYERLST